MFLTTPALSSAQFKEAVLRKCRESAEMKEQFFDANAGVIEQVCSRLAQTLADGHKLFVMGNGGSSCDAMHVAVEFVHPIIEKRKAFPAFALTNDTVLLTAISNDSDFSHTFSEQLQLFGAPGDAVTRDLHQRHVGKRQLWPAGGARDGDADDRICGQGWRPHQGYRRVLSYRPIVQHSSHSRGPHDSAAHSLGHGACAVRRGRHYLMDKEFALSCPLPVTHHKTIVLGHGSGGRLTSQLIHDLFLPAFDNPTLRRLDDQAVLQIDGARIAFTTDSFVVTPLFFPGGDIGKLAVNGTVNDLAMSGAKPLYLSAAFIMEEGFSIEELTRVTQSMADAAPLGGRSDCHRRYEGSEPRLGGQAVHHYLRRGASATRTVNIGI